jgi:hypothetical protein
VIVNVRTDPGDRDWTDDLLLGGCEGLSYAWQDDTQNASAPKVKLRLSAIPPSTAKQHLLGRDDYAVRLRIADQHLFRGHVGSDGWLYPADAETVEASAVGSEQRFADQLHAQSLDVLIGAQFYTQSVQLPIYSYDFTYTDGGGTTYTSVRTRLRSFLPLTTWLTMLASVGGYEGIDISPYVPKVLIGGFLRPTIQISRGGGFRNHRFDGSCYEMWQDLCILGNLIWWIDPVDVLHVAPRNMIVFNQWNGGAIGLTALRDSSILRLAEQIKAITFTYGNDETQRQNQRQNTNAVRYIGNTRGQYRTIEPPGDFPLSSYRLSGSAVGEGIQVNSRLRIPQRKSANSDVPLIPYGLKRTEQIPGPFGTTINVDIDPEPGSDDENKAQPLWVIADRRHIGSNAADQRLVPAEYFVRQYYGFELNRTSEFESTCSLIGVTPAEIAALTTPYQRISVPGRGVERFFVRECEFNLTDETVHLKAIGYIQPQIPIPPFDWGPP